IKGSPKLMDHIHKRCGIEDGQTTEDGKVSLLTARCIGACSMAPAVVLDGQMVGVVDEDKLDQQLQEWQSQ
ncbi:MAG: NAD(P)H-dependent oxidoreductase subunit E, partial [Rhodospirillales bacterium]|nr:NAD(P)H-dependent oxidoreductase subunit E [Rhodospirillales bacterium]